MEINIDLIRKGYNINSNFNNKKNKEIEDKIYDLTDGRYINYLKLSEGFKDAYNSNIIYNKINKKLDK